MSASQPATHAQAASQEGSTDALQLLKADHREVKAMFQQYHKLAEAGGKGDERMLLASQICVALALHAQVEEEIVYPAARLALPDGEDVLDEAYVEHASAKSLVAQIKTMTSDQPLFDARVKVLGEYVDHHVRKRRTSSSPGFARPRSTSRPWVNASRSARRR